MLIPSTPFPSELPSLKLDKQIWDNLMVKERTIKTAECLARHQIGPNHRAKMVSWMIEVLSELGSATQTLFLSIRYLDLFFMRSKAMLPLSHLHIAGATSMSLASKMEDVFPIPMRTLQEEIVHKSFTPSQLKKSELRMLRALSFELDIPTPLDFLGYLCEKLSVNGIVCHCAVNIAVMAQINYNGLRFLPSQQGVASLVLAATSTRQLKLVSQVYEITGLKVSDLVPVIDWMHANVTQFSKRYPKLTAPLECLRCTTVCSQVKRHKVPKQPAQLRTSSIVGPLFKFDDEVLEAAHQELLKSCK